MSMNELIANSLNSITVTVLTMIIVGLIITVAFVAVALYIFKRIDALASVLTPEQRKYYRRLINTRRKQLKTIDIPKVEPVTWPREMRQYHGPNRRH